MGEYSSVAMANEQASFRCCFAVFCHSSCLFIYFLIVWLHWDMSTLSYEKSKTFYITNKPMQSEKMNHDPE